MTFLFFLAYYLLLSHTASQAAPTNLPIGIDVVGIDEVDNANGRSKWNIVWSCLTTIFACTWVAIHPNIPGLRDSEWKILRRRLKLMVWVIFLPESVIFWAWRQYYGAKEVADRYNYERLQNMHLKLTLPTVLPLVGLEKPAWEERWTRTHGFFAIMGGFMLCRSDDKPIKILTPDEIFEHTAAGVIEWPKISKEEIWDRSKGDHLSKGIVVLQTFWFITTCLARAIQRLPITELEIVTLAFAALNGLIYIFWFHKPLDIRYPIHVHLDPSYHGPFLEFLDDAKAPVSVPLQNLHALGVMFAGGIEPSPGSLRRRMTHIKTFFTPESPNQGIKAGLYIMTAFALITGIRYVFGGIHLAAWSIQFPTDAEMWIWRVSSLTLLGSPFIIVAASTTAAIVNILFGPGACVPGLLVMYVVIECVYLIIIGVSMVAYLLARILLLILPFIAFRSLPPGALKDVQWTSFVPHIG